MRASIIIILIAIFTSCDYNSANRQGIELVLENKEVACIKKNVNKNSCLCYSTSEEDSAKTILKYRLVNHTNKRQLLVFDPFSPLTHNMRTIMYGHDGKEIKQGFSISHPVATPEYVEQFEERMKFLEYEDKKYRDFTTGWPATYKDYRENSVILQPGEERTFVSVISLPILNSEPGSAQYYGDISKAEYFSLWYTLSENLKFYRESIPDWEQQDLARRGINWYTGSVFSNKVPIRFIEATDINENASQ